VQVLAVEIIAAGVLWLAMTAYEPARRGPVIRAKVAALGSVLAFVGLIFQLRPIAAISDVAAVCAELTQRSHILIEHFSFARMDLAGVRQVVQIPNRAIEPVSIEFASRPVFFEPQKIAPGVINMLALMTVGISDRTKPVQIKERAANWFIAPDLTPTSLPASALISVITIIRRRIHPKCQQQNRGTQKELFTDNPHMRLSY
jgi:hypothetical protein